MNKHGPVCAPSMLKFEKKFRESSLKKSQDPEVWFTELKRFCVRLEDMDSYISENRFMTPMMNNQTQDDKLQLALMERRVGDK
jgi:hypothetical protein